MKSNVKLTIRYVVLAFFMYLAYWTITPEYLVQLKEYPKEIIIAINIAVYGALTLVLKAHFETKVEDRDVRVREEK
jgi:hypothetical protein